MDIFIIIIYDTIYIETTMWFEHNAINRKLIVRIQAFIYLI